MADRNEVERQINRWCSLLKDEAMALFDKGVGPTDLIGLAIKIADARLNAEVMEQQRSRLAITGPFPPRPPKH